ncbi:MAG: hypothetical protein BWY57_02470 [Betaproteobacteria bacterium ADurb.Bin341]|nr:MAG: hypothetical protein BWY57_02470 [Betaproteobacteria bacterium ADurb.Bin341]
MSLPQKLNARQKALEINLDPVLYGTLAEIGAGQEVARHFFQAGGAAGTVAKTMCAYDMTVSDTIYGNCGRYVSQERLLGMLDHEYNLLIERLTVRAGETRFFAYANTVQARNFKGDNECHGWMGVRFQHAPLAPLSQVIVHVRMLDRENLQQQEALGIIGVNLLYAAFRHPADRESFISTLMEDLSTARIEIDMIAVEGPGFAGADSRLYCLELVKRRFCQAVLFDAKGRPQRAADSLYKKNVLVLRGSFRPPTLLNLDMLHCGLQKFQASLPPEEQERIVELPEISMSALIERGGTVDNQDFLARVDLLAALAHGVLISNCESYAELSGYLAACSKKRLAFVMVVYSLEDLLDARHYGDRPDGLLGALGSLFGQSTKIYVYPAAEDNEAGKLRTLASVDVSENLKPLWHYLLGNGLVEEISDYNPELSGIWSRVVLKMIQNGEHGWESRVPTVVADWVKRGNLFGYRA